MKTSSTEQQQQIVRELSPQFLGISGAIAQITKSLDKPARIIPFKMPDAIIKTIVVRDGKEIEVQVELDEYEVKVGQYMELGEREIQDEYETEISVIRAYTTDSNMTDIVLTREETERVKSEFIEEFGK